MASSSSMMIFFATLVSTSTSVQGGKVSSSVAVSATGEIFGGLEEKSILKAMLQHLPDDLLFGEYQRRQALLEVKEDDVDNASPNGGTNKTHQAAETHGITKLSTRSQLVDIKSASHPVHSQEPSGSPLSRLRDAVRSFSLSTAVPHSHGDKNKAEGGATGPQHLPPDTSLSEHSETQATSACDEEKKIGIQVVFKQFDGDENGVLDANELDTLIAELKKKGYLATSDTTTGKQLVAELDLNNDGGIDLGEFTKWLCG